MCNAYIAQRQWLHCTDAMGALHRCNVLQRCIATLYDALQRYTMQCVHCTDAKRACMVAMRPLDMSMKYSKFDYVVACLSAAGLLMNNSLGLACIKNKIEAIYEIGKFTH